MIKDVLNEKLLMLEAEYTTKRDTAQQEMELVCREKEDLHGEVLLLRRALQGTIGPERMNVPKPKSYNGVTSGKMVKNKLKLNSF